MMMEILIVNFVISLLAMLLMWLISLWRRDASVVDPFWGMGFVLVAWSSFYQQLSDQPVFNADRMMLICSLVTIWGLRLSLYLIWRNWHEGEDARYGAMRNKWGEKFWWVSLFTVFLLQGILFWFIAMPVQWVAMMPQQMPLGWLDGMGVVLWLIGIFFETVGDWQLSRFRANPENKGRVLSSGLWRYTRHPNYFGDFCVWWGLYLISIGGGGFWTIASPLLLSVLLMKVSGVALTEKTISQRRPEYEQYKKVTSNFFPWPPRSKSK